MAFINSFLNPLQFANPLFGGIGMGGFGGGLASLAGAMLGGVLGGEMGGFAGFAMGGFPGAMIGGSLGSMLGSILGSGMGQCGCHPPVNYCPGYGGYPQPYGGNPGFSPRNCCCCDDDAGGLQQNNPGGPIQYTTHGGYGVNVNGSTVQITTPNGKHEVVEWGDPHEKLDGQAVQHDGTGDQWDAKTRTLILGDGTRITMDAQGHNTPIQSTSIYDGNRNIQINNNNNQVTHDSSNPWDTWERENDQTTGETGYFGPDGKGGYTLTDMYNQSPCGNITPAYKDLGNVGDSWWKSLLCDFGFPQNTSVFA